MGKVIAGVEVLVTMLLSGMGSIDSGYDLTIIEDEPVALAPKIQEPSFFPYAVLGLLAVLLILLVSIYVRICIQYQKRIKTLCGEGEAVSGSNSYSIFKLRKILEQKEIEVAETMME